MKWTNEKTGIVADRARGGWGGDVHCISALWHDVTFKC